MGRSDETEAKMEKQTYKVTGHSASTTLYVSEYTGTLRGLKAYVSKRRRDELPSTDSATMTAWVKGDRYKRNVLDN